MKISSRIIRLGDFIYRVYYYTTPENLELGNAYIFGGSMNGIRLNYSYVLPFRGELSKGEQEPGIYKDKKGKVHVIYPSSEKDRQLHHISRVFEITPETIKTELNQYLTEIDVTDLKYTGKAFEPPIKPNDDVGIKAVRLALWKKNIDFNNYANRFAKPSDRANKKKALMKDSTLTFSSLKGYADVFDFEYGLIIFDKEGARDPISKEGKAMVVFNDAHFPIQDENIEVISSIDDILKQREQNG